MILRTRKRLRIAIESSEKNWRSLSDEILVGVAPQSHVPVHQDVGGSFRGKVSVADGVHICFLTQTVSEQEGAGVTKRGSRQGPKVLNTESDTKA